MSLLTIYSNEELLHTFSFRELLTLPGRFQIADVSTQFPGRRGQAIRFDELIREIASDSDSFSELTLSSSSDDFCKSIDWALIPSGAVLIYALDGDPLPDSMGGPFRLLVPGTVVCGTATLDNCVNVKHLDRIDLK